MTHKERHCYQLLTTSPSKNAQTEPPTDYQLLGVNMNPPISFFCPSSGRLMTDPVIAADGKTYQRSSIESPFSNGHAAGPIDGSSQEIQRVVPNDELSAEVDEWEEEYLTNLPHDTFSLDSASLDACGCQTAVSGELHLPGVPSPCPVLISKIPSDRVKRSAVELLRLGRHPYLARIRGISEEGTETLLATEKPLHGPLLDAIFKLNEQNQQAVSWHHRILMVQQICVALNFLEQNSTPHNCLNSKNVLLFHFCEDNPERTLVKLSGYASSPCFHESKSRKAPMSPPTILEEQSKESNRVLKFGILALRVVSLGGFDSLIDPNLEEQKLCREDNSSSISAEERMPHGCPATMWMALKQCLHEDQSQRPSFSQLSEKLLGVDFEGSSRPAESRTLKISIKSLTGNFSFIEVKEDSSILDVKKVIHGKLGIDLTAQRVVYKGKVLNDSTSLRFHGCHSGSVLYLVLRLRCIAAAQPAPFGRYNSVIDDRCLFDVKSRKRVDMASVQEVINRNHGSLKLIPTMSKVRLLSLHGCKSLIKYLDCRSRSSPLKTDLILSLHRHELENIIGGQNIHVLEKYFGVSYDVIRVRRTVASENWIPFHLDDSRRTMQVALNSEDEYEGGKLVFATGKGYLEPARQAGFATTHTSFSVHGVTKLRRGVRYALFLCDIDGHYERKSIRYLVEASRKQLKFFQVAIKFLKGLADADIWGYILEYTNFMRHKRTDVPSFGVELVWRCHMISPVRYREFFRSLEIRDANGAPMDHVPRDPQEYCMRRPVVSSKQSIPGTNEHLLAIVRTQQEFMKHVLHKRAIENASQHFATAVEEYYGFLRHIRDNHTAVVPSVMVDLVWHTHMLFPLRYEKECHLIVGRLVDHKIV